MALNLMNVGASNKSPGKRRVPQARKKSSTPWFARVTKIVNIASEIGTTLMDLRDSPKKLDYLGAGIKILGVGMKIRDEYQLHKTKKGQYYFNETGPDSSGDKWIPVSWEMREFFNRFVEDAAVVQTHNAAVNDSWVPVVGYVGGEKVGWLEKNDKQVEGYGPYILENRKTQTYQKLGDLLWNEIGSNSCIYRTKQVLPEEFDLSEFKPSTAMTSLLNRAKSFYSNGYHRSILIQGPPGSGKSSTARWVARELGLRSLSVEMSSNYIGQEELSSVVRAMKPDVIIIDDLDRAAMGQRILQFLESNHQYCKITIITSNCQDAMLGAAMRPGRIDDIVLLNRLDRDWVVASVNGNVEVADLLESLPAAYVTEFTKRVKVLGKELAIAELPELIERAKIVEKKTKDETFLLAEANIRSSLHSEYSDKYGRYSADISDDDDDDDDDD